MRKWNYVRGGGEQDEVWRKREEIRLSKDRRAEKAWKQFWG